jgi:hypothetical protein
MTLAQLGRSQGAHGRAALAQRIATLVREREVNRKALRIPRAQFDPPPQPAELTFQWGTDDNTMFYLRLSQDEITANKAGHAVNAMFESRAKLGAGHDLFAGKNPFGDFFRGARGSTG